MKIYLDDERPTPQGWIGVKTPKEVIDFLQGGQVTEISLDHDLGISETGYDVLLWLEKAVICDGFKPPKIYIHTANVSARQKMELACKNIEKNSR